MPIASEEPHDEVLVELGRVTWRAIVLEGLIDSLCGSIEPSNPREEGNRQIGQKVQAAKKVLRTWPETTARDDARAWLIRAKAALDARNGLFHATALHAYDADMGMPRAVMLMLEPHLIRQPDGLSLGVMPRSQPYAEVPMTPGALEDVAAQLEAATEGWREVVLAASAEWQRLREQAAE